METNILGLFRQYNTLIERHKKAIAFFELNPDRVDEHIHAYRDIVNQLSHMRVDISKHGYVMSAEETLEGFRQIKYLEV